MCVHVCVCMHACVCLCVCIGVSVCACACIACLFLAGSGLGGLLSVGQLDKWGGRRRHWGLLPAGLCVLGAVGRVRVMFNCGGAQGSASWLHCCPSGVGGRSLGWFQDRITRAGHSPDRSCKGSLQGQRGRADLQGGPGAQGWFVGSSKPAVEPGQESGTLYMDMSGHGPASWTPAFSGFQPWWPVLSGLCREVQPRLYSQSRGMPGRFCESQLHMPSSTRVDGPM